MMKTTSCTSLLLLIIFLLSVPSFALDLPKLIREVETQYQGDSSHAQVRMQIQTEHWKRSLEMESWSQGRDRFLARIEEPAKEFGARLVVSAPLLAQELGRGSGLYVSWWKMLILIPFTRFSHMITAALTRAYTGSEFGNVRHARDW